ncbi:porin family protein [Thalassotalea psychrophila]|uniref:Porin family protein n=1 Tax=Thalassotalea psychrophila TaxID=3065647 RepID=A0ABY9TR78_9GAMM|nr:porin family protein [Colwelliaceae bacterium SQ149]
MKLMNSISIKIFILVLLLVVSFNALANQGDWYLKPSIGVSAFDDTDAELNSIVNSSEKIDIEFDPGVTLGIGLGYFFTDNISLELSFNQHENDADMTFSSVGIDANDKVEGEFKVSYLTINSYWHVQRKGSWRPYLGVGAGITTNAEVKVEATSNEVTLENDGDLVFQLIFGFDYELTRQLALLTELKYTNIELTDLQRSSADQRLDNLQYNPFTLQFALLYSF